MRVIGVVDLRGGRAVRGYAGQRDQYKPIGDAVDLARRYVEDYKLAELYVADLDAIESVARPLKGSDHDRTIRDIADLGVPLWLDAGITSIDRARDAVDLGAAHVVVGLETLPSFDVLRSICAAIGGRRVAFSLDMRSGKPIAGREIPQKSPEWLAAQAVDAGAEHIVVLDLARVGTRTGVDFDLLGRVRSAATGVALIAGGGVRGVEDLERLAAAGCDGALVATALEALYSSFTR